MRMIKDALMLSYCFIVIVAGAWYVIYSDEVLFKTEITASSEDSCREYYGAYKLQRVDSLLFHNDLVKCIYY